MMKFLKAKINGTNILVAFLVVLLTLGVLGGCAGSSKPTEPDIVDPLPPVQPSDSSEYAGPVLVATEGTAATTVPVTTEATEPPVTEPAVTEPVETEPPVTTVPTVPATKPVETTPATTAPTPTQPPETEPPATIAPVYDCGVEGHICKSETYHASLMRYIEAGCTHCGSSECPCLLSIDIDGCTWPDYTKCPQYDAHNDPTVYCEDCGLIIAKRSLESGQECCRKCITDAICSWCQTMRTGGECHRCTKP